MNTCKTCRFRGKAGAADSDEESEEHWHTPEYRKCKNPKAFNEDNLENKEAAWPADGLMYTDAEGYQAFLYTGPDFGCIHHEEATHSSTPSLTLVCRSGAVLIAEERQRQVEKEGWTAEHDDAHDNGSLSMAAACYAADEPIFTATKCQAGFAFVDPWPFEPHWDKRHNGRDAPNRKKQLVRAGALIAAELDRLQRRKT